MSSYLIYLPGLPHEIGDRHQRLRDVGLGFLLEPDDNVRSVDFTETNLRDLGPDDGNGVLVSFSNRDYPEAMPRKLLKASEHDWTPAKPDPDKGLAAKRFWLGKPKGQRVQPEHITRPKLYHSEAVKLADGQEWLMPIARQLPHAFRLDDEGRLARQVRPEMVDYFDASQRFYDMFVNLDADKTMDTVFEGGWSFASRGLGMNYLVNRDILDWLSLVDDTCFFWLIGASFEMGRMREIEAQKKTAHVTPAT